MCLSLPGKILSIQDNPDIKMADVDFGGIQREICIEWVPEAKVGDYVLAHVGTALSLLDEESALQSIAALGEIGQLLEEEDNLNLNKEINN